MNHRCHAVPSTVVVAVLGLLLAAQGPGVVREAKAEPAHLPHAVAAVERRAADRSLEALMDEEGLLDYIDGRLLVGFEPGTPASEKALIHERFGGQVIRDIPALGVQVLRFENEEALAMVSVYQDLDQVIFAEPDYIASIQGAPDGPAFQDAAFEPDAILRTPSDPLLSRQWHHDTIESREAWDVASGNGVVVAVIDTGVMCTHADLQGRCVAGYDFVFNDNDPRDDHGHGTHVSGIAAATTDNAVGVAGSGWGAKIMPVKALDSTGNGGHSSIASGITWAVDHGADVINMSLGGFFTSGTLRTAVAYAIDRGVVVVAAAGNEATSNPTYPASYPGVIGVSATTPSDQRASFSNFGIFVDVAAPGTGILSTTADGGYQAWSGTSMAAPVVAGLAALLVGQNPSRTPAQVEAIIEQTADDIGTPGRDDLFGYGRINARRATHNQLGTLTPGPGTGATPSPPPPPTSAPASATPSNDFALQVEELINIERVGAGLPPLHTHAALRVASRRHSNDMLQHGFCGHVGSDGSSAWERQRDAGYFNPYGEIVACGQVSPAAAVTTWMNSPAHRAIILCTPCTEMGAGHAGDGSQNDWTVTFGRRFNPDPTPTLALPSPPTAVATAGPTNTPALPTPTQAAPPDSVTLEIQPRNNRVGWVVSSQPSLNHFDDEDTYTGTWNSKNYHGAAQFDLSAIPVGATLNFARVELTGRSTEFLGTVGTWSVNVLRREIDPNFPNEGYTGIHNAAIDATLLPLLGVQDLSAGVVNAFSFTGAHITLLGDRLGSTRMLSIRTDGPTSGSFSNLFTWDTGYGADSRYAGPKLVVNYSTGPQTPLPTQTATPTALPTDPPTVGPSETPLPTGVPPTATATAPPPRPTATPTATLPPPPTVPPSDNALDIVPACSDVGYARQFESFNHFCDDNLFAGFYQNRAYFGGIQFDLSGIPRTSAIRSARLVLTGQSTRWLASGGNGLWNVKILTGASDAAWRSSSYARLGSAGISSALQPTLRQYDFGIGRENVFEFYPIHLEELAFRVATTGRMSFMVDGPKGGSSNVMDWDSGHGPGVRNPPRLQVVYGPPGSGEPIPTPVPESGEKATEMLRLINQVRVANGLPALQSDDRLIKASVVHNQDMARNAFFDHTGSDGSTPAQRAQRAGLLASAKVGEVIAARNQDPQAVVNAWMTQGWRQTLLDPDYTHVGVHYLSQPSARYLHYWTVTFARP